MMKKFFRLVGKNVAAILCAVAAVTAVFSFSPIYDFAQPRPFSGPDIFNPYQSLDTVLGWKRANFHTHSRISGLFNECRYWPEEMLEDYSRLGYDILTFSNHNRLTVHPADSSLQVNLYEHGYNLFKFHKLVFGAERVWRFDHLVPFLASQRQWQIDRLNSEADFVQLNHPFRTWCTTRHMMECLGSYRIIELDSGVTVDQEYWDWALSAGHYSFALANDDCHDSKRSEKIGVRCNFLNAASGRYEDLKKCLLSGCYYSMRIPDFGNGDWDEKIEKNMHLPQISDVTVDGDDVSIIFSEPAERVEAVGQNHCLLCECKDTAEVGYTLPSDEPYVRFTAFFRSGAVIYTNVFARYDRAVSATPYTESVHTLDIPLSILFNAACAVMAVLCIWLIGRIWRRKKA